MKKLIITLSMVLLVSGHIQADMGALVLNKSGNTIYNVTIDKNAEKPINEFKNGTQKFLPTTQYGKRGIYWETLTHKYQSRKYKWPLKFTIKENGNYEAETKHGLFKRTYKAQAKATKKRKSTKSRPKATVVEPGAKLTPAKTKEFDLSKNIYTQIYEELKKQKLLEIDPQIEKHKREFNTKTTTKKQKKELKNKLKDELEKKAKKVIETIQYELKVRYPATQYEFEKNKKINEILEKAGLKAIPLKEPLALNK